VVAGFFSSFHGVGCQIVASRASRVVTKTLARATASDAPLIPGDSKPKLKF
jgi:hypothetical protein